MRPRPYALSPAYLAYARGLRKLHRLIAVGLSESQEADEVRDSMDLPWQGLSDEEEARAGSLSEDLYSISDPPAPTEPMNPQAQSKLNEFYEARERGDWDRALALLWRWGKYVSPPLLAYLRGTAWLGAGDRESAALFFEHAHRLEPEDPQFFLAYLANADPSETRRDVDRVLEQSRDWSLAIVISAVRSAIRSEPRPSPDDYRRYAAILGDALKRPAGGDSRQDSKLRPHGYGCLGECHEAAGDVPAAIDAYTTGLAVYPDDRLLLAARGLLEYGSNPRAIVDLERATRLGVDLVWPYFALAGERFRERRFQECLDLCVVAQRFDAPESVKDLLAEWTAVARAESGPPPATDGAAFAEAVRTPDDLRALVPLGALFQGAA